MSADQKGKPPRVKGSPKTAVLCDQSDETFDDAVKIIQRLCTDEVG